MGWFGPSGDCGCCADAEPCEEPCCFPETSQFIKGFNVTITGIASNSCECEDVEFTINFGNDRCDCFMYAEIEIAGPHDCGNAVSGAGISLSCSESGITVDLSLLPDDGAQGETHWTQSHPPGTAPGDVVIDGLASYSPGDNESCDYTDAVVTATPIISSSNECCDDIV
jgi:hypothetical protein